MCVSASVSVCVCICTSRVRSAPFGVVFGALCPAHHPQSDGFSCFSDSQTERDWKAAGVYHLDDSRGSSSLGCHSPGPVDGDPYGLAGNVESPLETWKAPPTGYVCGTGNQTGGVSLQAVCWLQPHSGWSLMKLHRWAFCSLSSVVRYRINLLQARGKNTYMYTSSTAQGGGGSFRIENL